MDFEKRIQAVYDYYGPGHPNTLKIQKYISGYYRYNSPDYATALDERLVEIEAEMGIEREPIRDNVWISLGECPNFSNGIFGFHEDWIDLDFNVSGIRPIYYAGDKYVNMGWNFTQNTFVQDSIVQPQYVTDGQGLFNKHDKLHR